MSNTIYNFIDNMTISQSWKNLFKKIHIIYYENYIYGKKTDIHKWQYSKRVNNMKAEEKEHFKVRFNPWGLLFGPFYYIVKGIFIKGFILFALFLIFLLTGKISMLFEILLFIYCAIFANLDYFKTKILNNKDIKKNPQMLDDNIDEDFISEIIKEKKKSHWIFIFLALIMFFCGYKLTGKDNKSVKLKDEITTIPTVCQNENGCNAYIQNSISRIQKTKDKSKLAQYYYLMACAYMQKGDLQQALKTIDAGLVVNSNYLQMYNLKAYIYYWNKNYMTAITNYKIILAKAPRAKFLNFYIARCFYNLGDYPKTMEYLNKIRFREKNNPAFYELRALTYIKSGKLKAATEDLERAKDLYIQKDPVENKEKIEYLKEKIKTTVIQKRQK